MSWTVFATAIISAMLINNVILMQFLGICPFLGVSKKTSSAIGMSAAVMFVMVIASMVTYTIYDLILYRYGIPYISTIAFILVIASLVQLVEMILKKFSKSLYKSLGIYLPLITTNCAILGVSEANITNVWSSTTPFFNGLFEATAIAHHITGAPILSHCEHGKGAIEQIELFLELNIPIHKVTMSHTDKEADFGYHRQILSSGINVEYDQSLRQCDLAVPPSALLMKAMVDEGFINQIMLGTDGARRSLWSSLGGSPGLAWLYSGWSKKLLEIGFTQAQLDTIFIDNPAKALTLDMHKSAASRGQ
jgi:electron transport complex protein RnfA